MPRFMKWASQGYKLMCRAGKAVVDEARSFSICQALADYVWSGQ